MHKPGSWNWDRNDLRSTEYYDPIISTNKCHCCGCPVELVVTPDLLEALKALLSVAEGMHAHPEPEEFAQARAAIAKATQ